MQSSNASAPWGDDPTAAEPHSRSRAARRMTEHAVVALLVALVALLLVASWPFLSGLVEEGRAAVAHRGVGRALRLRGWAVGPPSPPQHSRYAPLPSDRDDSLMDHLMPSPHGPMVNAEGRGAFARGELSLLDRAADDADEVTTLAPGTAAVVVEDTGVWLLVALQKNGRTILGWTTRDQLVILP